MGAHVWSFLPVAALLIIVPGPDTALVTKNAVIHGRRAALATVAGSLWQIANPPAVLAELYRSEPALRHACVEVGPRLQRPPDPPSQDLAVDEDLIVERGVRDRLVPLQ